VAPTPATPRIGKRRHPGRNLLLLAVAITVVVAGAVVIIDRDSHQDIPAPTTASAPPDVTAPQPTTPPDAVGLATDAARQIDLETDSAPSHIAIGPDAVWTAHQLDDVVTRLDPTTGKVEASIPVADGPMSLVATEDAVWVRLTLADAIARIDPTTNEVDAVIPTGETPVALTAADDGGIWFTTLSPTTLGRIHPGDAEATTFELEFPLEHVEVIADNPAVMLFSQGNTRLRLYTEATNKLSSPKQGAEYPTVDGLIAHDGHYLWAADQLGSEVFEVGPMDGSGITSTVAARVDVPEGIAAVAAGEDAAWVLELGGSTLIRLAADPATGAITRTDYPLKGTLQTVAVGHDAVWLGPPPSGRGTLTRIPLTD